MAQPENIPLPLATTLNPLPLCSSSPLPYPLTPSPSPPPPQKKRRRRRNGDGGGGIISDRKTSHGTQRPESPTFTIFTLWWSLCTSYLFSKSYRRQLGSVLLCFAWRLSTAGELPLFAVCSHALNLILFQILQLDDCEGLYVHLTTVGCAVCHWFFVPQAIFRTLLVILWRIDPGLTSKQANTVTGLAELDHVQYRRFAE